MILQIFKRCFYPDFFFSAKVDINRVHDLEMEFLAAIVSDLLDLV